MKLLFVLSEYLPQSGGGIISYYAGVLPGLAAAGHRVEVLVASADFLDRETAEINGVRISYLKTEHLAGCAAGFGRFKLEHPAFSAFLPVAWAAFRQVNGGTGFDLVETTDFPMLYAPWVSGDAAVPVNISLHGSPGQLDWYDSPGGASLDSDLLRLVERAAFGSAPSVQANSGANARFWQAMTHREIPVLPPAYRPEEARIPAAAPSGCGLVVGRLQRWKGARVLCQALENLPGVTVRWIGQDVTDPQTGGLFSKTLSAEYPGVFGTRLCHQPAMAHEDVRCGMAAADFLCIPSTWDVFNLTAVEAMAQGTPVICSTAAGASMLIQHGENGFLFDPGQPMQLADAIRQVRALSAADRLRLTAAAKETVATRLDPETLTAVRIQFYQDLIAGGPKRDCDPWLAATLSPRTESAKATDILGGFTAMDLLSGAGRQIIRGVRRRVAKEKS